MALSTFDDKTRAPHARDLKKALGGASAHWDDLMTHLATEYAPLVETWNFAGAKWGWSLRLKRKERTVLYMTPGKGYFSVGFVLGEKAFKACHESNLPHSLLAVIEGARKYAEGRGVRVQVRNKKDRDTVKKLAAIKMAH